MFVLESYNTVLYSLFITMLASRGSEGVMKVFPSKLHSILHLAVSYAREQVSLI